MSLPRLTSTRPMCSDGSTRALPRVGSPIRKSSDQRMFSSSPRLIAAVHVLHRHLTPRHPPRALSILTIFVEHTYVPLCSFQGTPSPARAGRGRARRSTVALGRSRTLSGSLKAEQHVSRAIFPRGNEPYAVKEKHFHAGRIEKTRVSTLFPGLRLTHVIRRCAGAREL